MKDGELKVIFRDIARGFTESRAFPFRVFIRHVNNLENADYEDKYSIFYDEFVKEGLPTKKERESYLFQNKMWTRKDEDKISIYQNDIDGYRNMMRVAFKISEKKNFESKIAENEKLLNDLLWKKSELIGRTAESAAEQRINDLVIFNSFYKDSKFEEKLYNEEEFDQISESELRVLYAEYSAFVRKINESAIKKIVASAFFTIYFSFLESSVDFFKKSAVEMTTLQQTLFVYAKIHKNLLERNHDAPEEIKRDFDELINYDDAKSKADKVINKSDVKGDKTTTFMIGAKNEDMKYMGIDPAQDPKYKTIKALKQKGGSLNVRDMDSIR